MVNARCPDCGATIGGAHYQLATGNTQVLQRYFYNTNYNISICNKMCILLGETKHKLDMFLAARINVAHYQNQNEVSHPVDVHY